MAYTRRTLLQTCLAAPALAQRPRPLEEVLVVFKTHFDIGYTDLTREVVARYRTSMIDKALDVIEQSRSLPPEHRFVWTVSGWPMAQILWPGQDPARKENVLAACRRHQFAVHALPFTTHTESLEIEDIVRGLHFASQLSRSLGLPLSRDAKMTDVPSHSWILPTILRHAGVEFLHLGCNAASSSPDIPLLFWWEGPDGSRILTMYSAGGYGSGLVPPDGWPHPVWLALIHTDDNEGPPAPEVIEKLLEEGRQKLPGVRIRFGRLSDFSDRLLPTRPTLPTVRGDMPDTWIHGIQTMPTETALVRSTRPRIAALEALHALLGAWSQDALPAPDIAAAREQSLLYGEHTWGMDAKKFPRLYGEDWRQARDAGKYQKLEEAYEEHRTYARTAAALTSQPLAEHMTHLARSIAVPGMRIVVFNPLAWTRNGVVEMAAPPEAPKALRDTVSGDAVPVEVRDGRLRFVARAIPPLGYRTFVAVPAPAEASQSLTASDKTVENEYLRVTVAPERGGISSIIDKRSGRELAGATGDLAIGQYVYERFSRSEVDSFFNAYVKSRLDWAYGDFTKPGLPDAPYQRLVARDMEAAVNRGPMTASVVLGPRAGAIHKTNLTVSLSAGCPWIDLSWSITGKQPDPWPEAGWLAIPLRVANPSFRLARLGAIVDPSRDLVRATNHELFCLNGGT